MNEVLHRLHCHIAQMAPHQKERSGGKLLIEAVEEIERLNHEIELTLEENSHLADGEVCTLSRLKKAIGL